jgi:hypothetical protein
MNPLAALTNSTTDVSNSRISVCLTDLKAFQVSSSYFQVLRIDLLVSSNSEYISESMDPFYTIDRIP